MLAEGPQTVVRSCVKSCWRKDLRSLVLSLRTLGRIELTRGETPVLPRRRKELVLLALLARRSPRGVTRAELAALLWGNRDETRARHSLRQSISELKAELGESLEITSETVRLTPGAVALDLRTFETAAEAGPEEEAAKLWQGDFLAGCEDLAAEELRTWIEQERAGLHAQLARVYRRLADRARASGDWRSAIAVAEEWCRALPYDEDAHRSAVETLRIAGKNAEAAARHAGFVSRLRTDLDASPSEEFVRLGATLDLDAGPLRRGQRGLLSPDLVGRTDALGLLQLTWREATGGRGAVALIQGDLGSGKSRLCRELVRIVKNGPAPATVIEGRAFAAEHDRPWSAFRPLLEALAGAPGFRAVPPAALARAAGIAPEIRERIPGLEQVAPDASTAESVTRVITEVAAELPLLLIVDDVFAADHASLEVIRGLVRRPPPGLFLVLAGAAGSLAASGLEQDLRQAAGHVTRIELSPLDRRDVAMMLASMMPLDPDSSTRLSTHLQRASAGNPGRIEPFLFGLMDAGVLALGADGRWQLTRDPDRARRRLGLFAGAAGVVMLILGWMLLRPGPASVAQGGQIVLADVQNATSDSALGRAFYSAATIGLQGSRYLSLFPRSRVRETLGRMGRPGGDGTLSETVAREVAVREGVSRVVALGVTQVDSAFLLSARVVDPETGHDLDALSLRVERRADLLEGMDRLLQRTRKSLGESSRELRANTQPLPRITTSSLDALRAYVAGGEAWTRRDLVAAQEHWRRALALDSSFALAMAAMADLEYFGNNNRPEGDRWMNRALSQLHRLTEREQLRIQGQAALGQGREASAVEFARLLAERYPTRDTWYNHGTTLMRYYRCREAIPSLRKALSLDSLFTVGHNNLATCLQLEGRIEEALSAYAAAGRSDSLALYRDNINHEWGVAFVRAGRPAAAESAYTRMAETGRAYDRARGLRSLAWLAMYRGRFRSAVDHLSEAISLYRTGPAPVSIFRNQVILAQAYLALGDAGRARRMLDTAMATAKGVSLEPAFLLYLGQAQLRAGRVTAARASLESLRAGIRPTSSYDRAIQQGLEAPVSLAGGRVPEAIEIAAPDHDSRTAAFRLSALAQAYGAAGQLDSALAAAVRLSNTFAFGEEAQVEWQRGPLLVARFAEARGDSATARAAYSRLIEQWKGGDQDLPDLVLARRALARLQSGER
jgi:DNA-binding SARP family transcriptional activator/Tfp pilus assembly protein PilF